MNTSTALFLAATTPLLAQATQLRPPKRPEKPFRILVFSEPRGELAAVARILEAEKECHKIVKRRTDWFVTAVDRQQAEIVMEIKASWMDERITTETLGGNDVTITRDRYYLFAEVTILGGEFGLRADDGRSVKGAASKLMDALEEFCKKNYWEILGRRDKDPVTKTSWPHNLRIWTPVLGGHGGGAMRNASVAWAVGVSLALGSLSSRAQDRFPTMASLQGRMPCGSCRLPSTISSPATIAPPSEAGERLVISGTIYEPDGVTAAPAITIFVYHTDARGHYNSPDDALNPRLYGWVRTGPDGRYEFRTIRPGPYPQLTTPAHIHVHVFGPGRPEWFIPEYWFEGDPLIPAKDRDLPSRLGPFSPVVRLTKDSDGGWRGRRDIRLEKAALQ